MNNNTDSALARTIIVSRHFSATSEQVFDAWLDPKAVGSWLFASPDGVMKRVELDPQVGGHFIISEQRGDTLAEHFGEYLQIERPHRLVFGYNMDPEEKLTIVTIKIVATEDGCQLTLSHDMDPKWADMIELARAGWTTILEGLAAVVESKSLESEISPHNI